MFCLLAHYALRLMRPTLDKEIELEAYEQRIIGYVDVLGWSDSCKDALQFPQLRDAANTILSHAKNFSPQVKESIRNAPGIPPEIVEQHASIEFSFFSDNFVVSAPVEHARMFFNILAFISHHLLVHEFSVRGGVTLGSLYHNNGVVFGPALIEAVSLEKEAHFPRLLCSSELNKFLDGTDYKRDVLSSDIFGTLVVNIAWGNPSAMSHVKDIASKKVLEYAGNVKNKEKWIYLEEMLPIMQKSK